jgi:anti-sigma regulatory factor (Ser/Thr protein kinase)
MKSVGVNDQSGVAEARRAATDLAGRAGFTDVDAGKLALIATELSTNLLKHGSGGEILVGNYDDNESQGIEILALDKGAGMSNVAACLEDGYSSAGTSGHGLGSVIRQSHFVDIGSWPGLGTAVLARVAPGKPESGNTDVGRRFSRQDGGGCLWRRLGRFQRGGRPDLAGRRRAGPRAGCGGSIG